MLENVLVLKSYTVLTCTHINLAYMCVVAQACGELRIALYMASPPYEGLFRWRGRFRLEKVDPLKERHSTVEGVAQSFYVDTVSCSAVGRPPLLGERLFGKQALVWCLPGIDYEMPKFDSDDLVVGSGPCPSNPTVALFFSLHSGIEATLMCLDSLRLPSCARNPHVGFPYHVFSSDKLKIDRGTISRKSVGHDVFLRPGSV
ncbi:hypothetical protein M9H77_34769 [Catharanthus roseus]|uniref:Uncharacterized protein n=1 Tax=Catharanthus roseus TaxID=4058 RepID=A0ACB9ZNU6_CATRO|nr:hypothetical protein M9H77_34769 [Catharanthus roseus]